VKDVFSKNFKTVNDSDPLSKCWKLFKTETPPVLAVVDEKCKYAGIISRRWVVRSRLDHATTKVKTLMRSAPIVAPEFSLSRTAKLMIESGIRQLPVFENKKILGFITDEKIIQRTIIQEWGNSIVEMIMTKTPHTIESTRSIGAVLNLIRENGISHIPVTINGKLAGIISIQDIIEYIYQPKISQTKGDFIGEKNSIINMPAKGIMTKPVITISPEKSLKEAIKKMRNHKISSLVVTKNEKIVGIITKLDFLEPISQMEKKKKEFEIQFGVKDIVISPYQKGFLLDEFNSFIYKYQETLISGTLFVYIKTHGQSNKGSPLIHCRLQLKTTKGAFFSSSEGYGIESTFRLALDRLDRRLLRSKELAHNPKYARDYLQTIGFPQEEL
jgi:CBS domain-containing protein